MILLAEDNDVLRTAMRVILTGLGMLVHEAKDGLQAVEHSQLECCKVILMDVMMPGMSGLDAAREIRKTSAKQAKIIVVSAGDTTREQALAAGADDFISKPILREQLHYVVQNYCQSK